jgi:CRP-like cAMP-binding protein
MGKEVDPAAVQRVRGFQGLSEADAKVVALLLEPLQLVPGQVLFRQGEPGDALYLLIAGAVEIQLRIPQQQDHVCATLDAGAIFGEISPLLDEPRTATVQAKTEVQLWQLSRARLHAALARGDAWASKFLLATVQDLARRLMAMNDKVMALVAERHKDEETSARGDTADSEQLFDEELLGLVKRALL